MILIAGIGIASAVDITKPNQPAFKWMNEDMFQAPDLPFTSSEAQEHKTNCSTCGSGKATPFTKVQEYDAPTVAPLAIREAAPQASSPIAPQENPTIKPTPTRTPAPALEARFTYENVPCIPYDPYNELGYAYCVEFTDHSVAVGGEEIVLWDWDFSDGRVLSYHQENYRKNPRHLFPQIGDYVVILRTTSNTFNTSTDYKIVSVS